MAIDLPLEASLNRLPLLCKIITLYMHIWYKSTLSCRYHIYLFSEIDFVIALCNDENFLLQGMLLLVETVSPVL